jgi:hypothetical protein
VAVALGLFSNAHEFNAGATTMNTLTSKILSPALLVAAVLLSMACVQVSKNGKNSDNVDVKTPFASISVHTDKVKPEETGLNVYPGARLSTSKHDGDDDKANVNITSPWGDLKVIALNYKSDDAPDKVLGWYKKDMAQKYGRVLECRGDTYVGMDKENGKDNDKDSQAITCEDKGKSHGDHFGNIDIHDKDTTELKAGTRDKQHIVAIKPEGSGSSIALVYVQMHGEKDSI